ncbi:hypothetical protein LAD64_27645 [Klebsiella pneumoniae]|nr:hypothetical protein [Klebsiella pneumoniae]
MKFTHQDGSLHVYQQVGGLRLLLLKIAPHVGAGSLRCGHEDCTWEDGACSTRWKLSCRLGVALFFVGWQNGDVVCFDEGFKFLDGNATRSLNSFQGLTAPRVGSRAKQQVLDGQ